MSTFHTNTEGIDVDNNSTNNSHLSTDSTEVICVDNSNSDDKEEEDFVFNTILDKHNSNLFI